MNRSTAVLGVALAVSLLLNVVAFSRGRDDASPDGSGARSSRPAKAEGKGEAATSGDVASDLEREKKLTRELRDTIKRLEAESEVLAQAATSGAPVAAAKSPTAGLREKLRKLKKLMKAGEEGLQPEQEAVVEMSGEIMEIMKLGLTRGKDPKTYAEFLQAVAEVSLEDAAALTPAQTAEYARVAQEMADALGRIAAASPGERLIRELEIESDAFSRFETILTPEQKDVLKKGGMDDVASMSSSMSTTYLQKATAADMIVKSWTQLYQLQEAQLPSARAAAASFLRELEGLAPKPTLGAAGAYELSSMSYESRIASLRAQMAALKTLQGSLTGTQLDRLGTQAPREFRVFDFATSIEVPEKK